MFVPATHTVIVLCKVLWVLWTCELAGEKFTIQIENYIEKSTIAFPTLLDLLVP